jgi:glycosyltransferase involved in cell wall biosynthesis
VGHYREASGWGQVTRDQILALDRAGIPVVPRSLDLGLAWAPVPDRILELEQGDPTKCEIIVQHVLPHYMKYDNHFRKNIGMFELETQNIQHTQWVDHLNIMDELWVPCQDMLNLSGIKKRTLWVPHACDEQEYQQDIPDIVLQHLTNKFIFYFIGTFNRRKHLAALIRAFHTEFDSFEPVELVIKTNKPGMDSESLAQEVTSMCLKIKENLRLYDSKDRYKKETIITADIPRDQLLGLHKACDCFVMPSFGEAWCAPLFDAMAMSNIVIAGKFGGPKDYINNEISGLLVEGSMEPVFGETEAFPGFGTARELEFDISISDLQKKMRQAYHLTHVERQLMGSAASLIAARHSYAVIGERMKELLSV